MVTALHPVLQTCVVALSLLAAVFDVRTRRIPNWLVVAGLISGFAGNVMLFGLSGLATAALGLTLAFLAYIPLCVLRATGGGDLKLNVALGAMCGPHTWFYIFVNASIAGGIFALVLIVLRRSLRRALGNLAHIFGELSPLRLPVCSRPELDVLHQQSFSVPHGVAIAVGAILFLYSQGT